MSLRSHMCAFLPSYLATLGTSLSNSQSSSHTWKWYSMHWWFRRKSPQFVAESPSSSTWTSSKSPPFITKDLYQPTLRFSKLDPWHPLESPRVDLPFLLLRDCFSFGALFSTRLLELLGSPTPEYFNLNFSMDDRKEFFVNFIDRVHALEGQGWLSYGEVVRVDDFTRAVSCFKTCASSSGWPHACQ